MEIFGSKAVEYLTEKELNDKYRSSLESKYSVKRTINKRFSIQRIGKIAAIFLFVVSATFITRTLLEVDSVSLAEQLLLETKMIGNPDSMRKGKPNLSLVRTNANTAFINSNYLEAIQHFESINETDRSHLDKLYLGISYTHSKNYSKSLELFNSCKSSYLSEEANWYLALVLVLTENDGAEKMLNDIVKTKSYQYKNAQLLLSKF